MDKEIVDMIEAYSVSLVFVKIDNIKTDSPLRCIIIEANSEDEALGKAINHFREETKNHNLSMRVVIPIAGRSKSIERIYELEMWHEQNTIVHEELKQNYLKLFEEDKKKDERIKELEKCLENIIELKSMATNTQELFPVLQAIDKAKQLLK